MKKFISTSLITLSLFSSLSAAAYRVEPINYGNFDRYGKYRYYKQGYRYSK